MKKKTKSSGLSLKDKLNLSLTLLVLGLIGFYFFYINGTAILELLHLNPNLLNNSLRYSFTVLIVSCGIWLILPVKIRLTLEALINSAAQVKAKNLILNQSLNYPHVLATKLRPTPSIRLAGLILIILGLIVYFYL